MKFPKRKCFSDSVSLVWSWFCLCFSAARFVAWTILSHPHGHCCCSRWELAPSQPPLHPQQDQRAGAALDILCPLTALQLGQPQPVTVLFFFSPSLPPLLFLIFLSKKCLLAHLHKKVLPPASFPCPCKLSRARAQPDHELTITACDIPDHRL